MGFSRRAYWSGLLCLPPRDLANTGIEPTSLMSSALSGGFFTTSATWEAPVDEARNILVCVAIFSHPALEERVWFLGAVDSWNESYKSRGVVIPHSLGISKSLQEGIGLDDLIF